MLACRLIGGFYVGGGGLNVASMECGMEDYGV